MKHSVLSFFMLISVICFSQEDYYTVTKGGKKYKKIIRYLSVEKGEKKKLENLIFFNIDKQQFKFNKDIHEIDTLDLEKIKKYNPISVKQLFEDEYKEHIEKTRQEGVKTPPPFNHYNIKVYILETIDRCRFIKYEVDWLYYVF